MNGDRDDLRDRLDAVADAVDDDAEPLFVFPDGDGGHVDKHGDPVSTTGDESPGRIVIPPTVTDEWAGEWGGT